jgi:hypothetical protein
MDIDETATRDRMPVITDPEEMLEWFAAQPLWPDDNEVEVALCRVGRNSEPGLLYGLHLEGALSSEARPHSPVPRGRVPSTRTDTSTMTRGGTYSSTPGPRSTAREQSDRQSPSSYGGGRCRNVALTGLGPTTEK